MVIMREKRKGNLQPQNAERVVDAKSARWFARAWGIKRGFNVATRWHRYDAGQRGNHHKVSLDLGDLRAILAAVVAENRQVAFELAQHLLSELVEQEKRRAPITAPTQRNA